ncbi:hypothetical protein BGW38_009962, partial [Lunasporangiospora selenospora]
MPVTPSPLSISTEMGGTCLDRSSALIASHACGLTVSGQSSASDSATTIQKRRRLFSVSASTTPLTPLSADAWSLPLTGLDVLGHGAFSNAGHYRQSLQQQHQQHPHQHQQQQYPILSAVHPPC